MPIRYTWKVEHIESRSYTCGVCGNRVASDKGWQAIAGHPNVIAPAYVVVCPHCTMPTFLDHRGHQWPGVPFGQSVEHIPEEAIEKLYDEARMCMSVEGYTAAVLCCRKLLMHIAVAKGAEVGKNFVEYVQYLADNHLIPSGSQDWVDHIRKKGNEANHDITIMGKEDSEELLTFIEMLLKVIFEFPARAKREGSTR
jgi:hypothetical protein